MLVDLEDVATPKVWSRRVVMQRKQLHVAAFLEACFSVLHTLLIEKL